MILDEIREKIENADTIAIIVHENPDGDAIGSGLGMYQVLKKIGKNVDIIIPEYAKVFEIMPCINESIREGNREYDLAISLDCATKLRLADPSNSFEKAKSTIVIDHHVVNSMYGETNYVDHVSPACCQILVKLFEYWNYEIDKNIGICLLTGIITDTGGFAYEGVNSETLQIAAKLLDKGINIAGIYRKLMVKSKAKFELAKIVTDRIEFFEDGKIAFTYITSEDEKITGAQNGDTEGCVEIGRDIEGVEVSVFLREIFEDVYKVSMRSNSYVNVSDICLVFGGGGHIKAAGCTVTGNIEQARKKILKQIKSNLK